MLRIALVGMIHPKRVGESVPVQDAESAIIASAERLDKTNTLTGVLRKHPLHEHPQRRHQRCGGGGMRGVDSAFRRHSQLIKTIYLASIQSQSA